MSNVVSGILGKVGPFIAHHVGEVLATIFFGIICLIFTKLLTKIKEVREYFGRIEAAKNAVSQIERNGGMVEGEGLWKAAPIIPRPEGYYLNLQLAKILSIANLKGGVGKTTISANLASCLSIMLNEGRADPRPVLLIDLDFQGTLAGFANPHADIWPPKNTDSYATKLIRGDLTKHNVVTMNFTVTGRNNLKILPAYYDLANAENRLMIEWLLGDRNKDVRFNLADILLNQEVRDQFSLIILDCPPRLTTAKIQALAASSHLLIPTILNKASTEAVNSFVRQVESLRKAGICPHIKHIGVVGSMVPPGAKPENLAFDPNLLKLGDLLNSPWDEGGPGTEIKILPGETFIPKFKVLAEAFGEGIIYPFNGSDNSSPKINLAIEKLAQEVINRMGLRH